MIQIRNIALVLLVILFILGSGVFTLTPLGRNFQLASMFAAFIGYAVFFFYFKRFPPILRFAGIVFPLLLAQSILSTHFIYGQSIGEGFAANIPVFLAGMMFLVYFIALRYEFSLASLERILIMIAWCTFLSFVYIHVTGVEFSLDEDKTFGVEFLNKSILNLCACLYLERYFRLGKVYFLLAALVLYSPNFWVDFQRAIFAIFLVAIAVMIYHYRKRTTGVLLLLSILILIPAFLLTLQYTEFGQALTEKFGSVVELFEEDTSNLSDESITARVSETEFALETIRAHPVLGVGKIKGSLLEELTGAEHFFLTDIGVLGILSCFGLTGLLVYLLQWRYWFQNYRKGNFLSIPSTVAFKLYLLLILLHSILSGLTLFLPTEFFLAVCMIEIGKFRHEDGA